jgi:hypothetical protein
MRLWKRELKRKEELGVENEADEREESGRGKREDNRDSDHSPEGK